MKAILCLACLALSGGVVSAAEPLNVVFILADDLGWADLGCYGSKYHKTPNIDRLAAQGLRFTDGLRRVPGLLADAGFDHDRQVSGPAGHHRLAARPARSARSKIDRPELVNDLPRREVTLAAAFKQAGYVTGHIGKWHLGGKGALPHASRLRREHRRRRRPAARAVTSLRIKAEARRFMPGLGRGPRRRISHRSPGRRSREVHRHQQGQAVLPLSAALHRSHPDEGEGRADRQVQARPAGQQGNPIYAAMIESLDDAVGRVLKKLDELKLTEHTIVIFTSDNGGLCTLEGPNTPPTINAPLREGKGYLYEGGIREPLIVKWPGVTQAGQHRPTCRFAASTSSRRCSTPAASRSDAQVDGVSLVPLLKGGTLTRDALYWHYPHYSNQGGKPGGAIRGGRVQAHRVLRERPSGTVRRRERSRRASQP